MRKSDRNSLRGDSPALTKETYRLGWEDVPKTHIRNPIEALAKAREVLSKSNEEWNRRCEQLKIIRAVILQERGLHSDYFQLLNDSLEISLKDLRSQIMKEAALTISFLISHFGMAMRQLAEQCLPVAFAQVAVSTKVMALNAAMVSQYIVETIHNKKIFKIIESFVFSKDKNQRKQAAVLFGTILEKWDDSLVNPQFPHLVDLVKTAILDADSNTRVAGRKAYQLMDAHYPLEAKKLFLAVDAKQQKMLAAPDGGSSTASLNGRDRMNVPFKSDLSKPSFTGFLAKRSVSASENLEKVDVSPGGSKFTRPANSQIPRLSIRSQSSPVSDCIPAKASASSPGTNQPPEKVVTAINPASNRASFKPAQLIKFKEIVDEARLPSPPEIASENYDDEFFLLPPKCVEKVLGISPKVLKTRRSVPLILSPQVNTPSPRSRMMAIDPLTKRHSDLLPLTRLDLNSPPRPAPPSSQMTERNDIRNNISLMLSKEEVNVLQGLTSMQKMIGDGRFTLWDEQFAEIYSVVFNHLRSDSESIKKRALRFLNKVCMVRASALFQETVSIIPKIIQVATTAADSTTRNSAVECLKVLSTHLPKETVVSYVSISLMNANDCEKAFLVTVIEEMFEKLDDYELTDVLQDVAPKVVEIYSTTGVATLRKAVVQTLIAMRNKMGEERMRPFIASLAPVKQELLNRFSDRKSSQF